MRKLLLAIVLFSSSISYSEKIVFDLGGVLLNQNSAWAYPHFLLTLGPINILKYYCYNKSIREAHDRIFEFGNLIFKQDCKNAWFAGEILSEELVTTISENIYKDEYSYFFKNDSERELIAQGIYLLLPENLVKITNMDAQGFNIVKECYNAGHELFILSNWDAISIELVKNKFPELFSMFKSENIIISGQHKKTKPNNDAFQIALGDNDPAEYYFIDDLQENIDAANALGINGILHSNWKSTNNIFIQKQLI